MKGIMVLGLILLVFLLLGFLRLQLFVLYQDTIRIKLRIGPVSRTIVPTGRKKKKRPKEAEQSAEEDTTGQSGKKGRLSGLSRDDWAELIPVLWGSLVKSARRACRRMCIDPMQITIVFSDNDPSFAASMYGTANTLLFTVFPKLEEMFDIPDPSIHLKINFEESQPSLDGKMGISLYLYDLLAIFLTLAFPLLKWYLRFRKHAENTKRAG